MITRQAELDFTHEDLTEICEILMREHNILQDSTILKKYPYRALMGIIQIIGGVISFRFVGEKATVLVTEIGANFNQKESDFNLSGGPDEEVVLNNEPNFTEDELKKFHKQSPETKDEDFEMPEKTEVAEDKLTGFKQHYPATKEEVFMPAEKTEVVDTPPEELEKEPKPDPITPEKKGKTIMASNKLDFLNG